jgi:threonine dehydratase
VSGPVGDRVAWKDIEAARRRIAPLAHRTPVHTSRLLDAACGATVFLKCENFQRTGSFKFRGASNAVAALAPSEKACGVVADSSGNHAQALALAACLHQVQATLVMPENASPPKVEATRGYGASVVFCAPTHAGRQAAVERLVRESGAVHVSPHDDPLVIAGQATAACELIEEVPDLDMLLAPVGGGGLLSGTLLAARHSAKKVRVVGCEPAGADDASRSLRLGERVTNFDPQTIADGLRTPLGEIAFDILRHEALDDLVLVAEDEILTTMRFVWERTKLVIEPSAAVAVAPLIFGKLGRGKADAAGKRVGVIVSGGNVDLGPFFAAWKGAP